MTTFVEIGPHNSLETPIKDIWKTLGNKTTNLNYIPTLRRGKDSISTCLDMAATLFITGHRVNLSNVNFPQSAPAPKLLGDLPPYAWMHGKSYWHESRLSRDYRLRPFVRHDILGVLDSGSTNIEPKWRNILRLSEVPWLEEHKVESTPVFPFAAYMTMIIQAAFQKALLNGLLVSDDSRYNLREVSVYRPITLPSASSEVETSLTLRSFSTGVRESSDTWDEFRISSWQEAKGCTENCRGLIQIVSDTTKVNQVDGERETNEVKAAYTSMQLEMQEKCDVEVDVDKSYDKVHSLGVQFGLLFRAIEKSKTCRGSSVGIVEVSETAHSMPYSHESDSVIHPTFLDGCFHATFFALNGGPLQSSGLFLPTFITSMSVKHGPSRLPGNRYDIYGVAELDLSESKTDGSVWVFGKDTKDGIPLLEVKGLTLSRVANRDSDKTESLDLCFRTQWESHIDLLLQDQYPVVLATPRNREQASLQARTAERVAFHYLQSYFALEPNNDCLELPDYLQRLQGALRHAFELGEKQLLSYQTEE